MDFFKFSRWAIKKMKLVLLYFRRILFAKNHFKCPFYKKIRANLSGGFRRISGCCMILIITTDTNTSRNSTGTAQDISMSRLTLCATTRIASAEILKQYVRVPESYMIKNRGFLSSFQSVAMEYEDALTLLKEKGSYFFKPYGKGKGTGVVIMTYDYEKDTPCIDLKPITKEEFINYLKKHDDWFLSEAMKQHHFLDEIYDKTVNTIRFITLKDPKTHQFKVFFAVQRIGTKETIPVVQRKPRRSCCQSSTLKRAC